MLSLILDTSTDLSFIVLSKEQKQLASSIFPHNQNLSKTLLPSINQLLLENNLTFQDLVAIFVGIGPGSYTGTRIAVVVAETLSISLNIPLYPFCSLFAFFPSDLPQGFFSFVSNTGYPKWFVLKGHFERGLIQLPCSQHILTREEALPLLESAPHLIYFESQPLPSSVESKNAEQFAAIPNPHLLISYLSSLEKLPAEKPSIIYLHQF